MQHTLSYLMRTHGCTELAGSGQGIRLCAAGLGVCLPQCVRVHLVDVRESERRRTCSCCCCCCCCFVYSPKSAIRRVDSRPMSVQFVLSYVTCHRSCPCLIRCQAGCVYGPIVTSFDHEPRNPRRIQSHTKAHPSQSQTDTSESRQIQRTKNFGTFDPAIQSSGRSRHVAP